MYHGGVCKPKKLASPGGLEPPACGLGNRRSIQLSYGDFSLIFIEIANGHEIRNDLGSVSAIISGVHPLEFTEL